MAQYIDKDALVAEIERRKSQLIEHGNTFSDKWACGSLDTILSFIDTLEVKEVDLDNVIENYIHENFGERWDGCVPVGCFELDSMAEHFYMLGFNARKEK